MHHIDMWGFKAQIDELFDKQMAGSTSRRGTS